MFMMYVCVHVCDVHLSMSHRKCVLLDVPRFCKYRFRLSESDDTWYYISQLARNRVSQQGNLNFVMVWLYSNDI